MLMEPEDMKNQHWSAEQEPQLGSTPHTQTQASALKKITIIHRENNQCVCFAVE